jgi:NTE family protein
MSGLQPGSRTRLGLVLGGGAALGAAHVGVLQVLEEVGISCPIVAGTSAGALIGAAYAAELPSQVITSAVLAAGWADFAQIRPGRRLGLLDTTPLERSIERHITARLIEELGRPFAALAWDLKTRQPVLLTEGPLSSALRASCTVPGLFPPVRIGDYLLVDGTLADNLPAWAARALGADLVIAVSLEQDIQPAATAEGRLLEAVRRYHPHPAAAGHRPPDVLMRPNTVGLPRWSPKGVPQLIAAGRDAAEAALPAISTLMAEAHRADLPQDNPGSPPTPPQDSPDQAP